MTPRHLMDPHMPVKQKHPVIWRLHEVKGQMRVHLPERPEKDIAMKMIQDIINISNSILER